MGSFREVIRCKKCKKIYADGIPKICYKCGAKLGEEPITIPFPTSYFGLMVNEMTKGRLEITDNCERVIARKKLFHWEVKDISEESEE